MSAPDEKKEAEKKNERLKASAASASSGAAAAGAAAASAKAASAKAASAKAASAKAAAATADKDPAGALGSAAAAAGPTPPTSPTAKLKDASATAARITRGKDDPAGAVQAVAGVAAPSVPGKPGGGSMAKVQSVAATAGSTASIASIAQGGPGGGPTADFAAVAGATSAGAGLAAVAGAGGVAAAVASAAATASSIASVAQTAKAFAKGDALDQALEWVGLGEKDRLDIVRYSFMYEDGDAELHVCRMTLRERICEPYELELDLQTTDLDLDPESLLGASCTLDIVRGDQLRSVSGIIAQVDLAGAAKHKLLVRVRVVPALAFLRDRVDSRIFQDMTVPQILKDVFDSLSHYGRKVKFDLGEYEPRDYCVQFREPDLDFALRLMQEEGISFYFDHEEEETELLILVDSNDRFPDAPVPEETLPVIPRNPQEASRESVQAFSWRISMYSTSAHRLDFDYLDPKKPICSEAQEIDRYGNERVVYEHGERRFINDDGKKLALRRKQALALPGETAVGVSNATGLSAGHVFELEGHYRPECDQRYLILSVTHFGHSRDVGDDGVSADPSHDGFSCEFECIPIEVPYRPPATVPRPRVYGNLTATVTGSDKEEVHTDPDGRIKIFMHWDRIGTRDDTSSCWVRVQQAWAGLAYGALCLPRVGMEVVVSFLDGNPDRPLVTGCVYNGDNPTPYTLPEHKTKTTFKSSSSPGGEGFNELRIEDAAGSEEIFMHAQKDFNAKVRNNCSWNVGASRSVCVGGDNSVTINGNHTMTIKGAGKGDFKGGKVHVTGDYKLDTTKTVSIQAPESITLTVGKSSITITPDNIYLKAGDGSTMYLDSFVKITSNDNSWVQMDKDVNILANNGATVDLTANVDLKSKGESKMTLDANALIESSGKAKVQLTANALLSGKVTECSSTDGGKAVMDANAVVAGKEMTCSGAGGSAKYDAAGATVVGKATTLAADATMTIVGNPIKVG